MGAPGMQRLVTRQIRRRLALSAGILALMLCIASAAAMALSAWYRFGDTGRPFYFSAECVRGAVHVAWFPTDPVSGSRSGFGNPGWRYAVSDRFGVSWLPTARFSGPIHEVSVPLWAPLLLFATATLACRNSARRNRDPSQCRCGYSLVGLPPGAPCPECGRAVPTSLARILRLVSKVLLPSRRADPRWA